jgi:hypothetical protein
MVHILKGIKKLDKNGFWSINLYRGLVLSYSGDFAKSGSFVGRKKSVQPKLIKKIGSFLGPVTESYYSGDPKTGQIQISDGPY